MAGITVIKFHIRIFIILIAVCCTNSMATDKIHMTCAGVTKGNTIRDSFHEFDIRVSLNPPDITGPAGPMNYCSLGVSEKKLSQLIFKCSVTDSALTCTCKGGDYILTSSHVLSRLSGTMTFISSLKDDVYFGDYKCRRLERKLF
jgi:hypothetical protein